MYGDKLQRDQLCHLKITLMETKARKHNPTNQNTVKMLKIGASLYLNNSIPCGKTISIKTPQNQHIEDIYPNTINIVFKDLMHLSDIKNTVILILEMRN